MKKIITLVLAAFIFSTSFAGVKPYSEHIVINIPKNTLKVTLQAGARVNLEWTAAEESTTTVYEIQKSENGDNFRTIAILMGESQPVYHFRDKINTVKGNVEYRVVTTDNNKVVASLSQQLVIL